ncbi:MAG: hypothetical protein KatS3mg095_0494 [Candidatus Parcubacteria bacterium]|nr:MAG: hypothetical protein KatS3mg095_0494 [Candidatus Parcubacteria bacterium]
MNLLRNKFLLLGLFLFLVFVILTFLFIYNKKNIAFKTKNSQDIIVDNPKENQKIKITFI